MKARKLSKREFERALKLGLGRVVLHVRDYGDKGIEDSLKRAMLHNYVYDTQFEGDRCQWLYSILSLTGRIRHYAESFYNEVKKSDPSDFDMRHRAVLAGLFFSTGFEEFRPIVTEFGLKLLTSRAHNMAGAGEVIDAAGLIGLEKVIRGICQAESDLSQVGYECHWIYEHAENGLMESIDRFLEKLEQQEPDLKRFREAVESFKNDSGPTAAERPDLTFEEFLQTVEEQKNKYSFVSRRFGRRANADELQSIFTLLLKETDWKKQYHYVSVFDSHEFPVINEKTFKFLDSPHHRLRHACAAVLGNSAGAKVRTRALKMLESGVDYKIPLALTMLEKNYRSTDAPLIFSALKKMSDPVQIHSAGGDVMDILEHGGGRELIDCIFWLYEHGPEAYCRHHFLYELIQWQVCPEEIIYEAQWDSGDEVQSLARDVQTRREEEEKVV